MLADVLIGTEEILSRRAGAAIPRSEWATIVGQRIAARTRVGKIYRGVLSVKVASSAWSNELSFLKVQLISKLRRAGHDILDLRFVVDNIAEDKTHKRKHPGARARHEPDEKPLPEDLMQRLRNVEDPNLRAAIFEAARASLNKG